MSRKHASIIALILALAAIAGGMAAMRTASIGSAARPPSLDTQIAQRSRQLDRAEASLTRTLQQAQVPVQGQLAPSTPSAQAQRVVYVRAAPHVITIHRAGGEHDGGGLDD